MITGTGRHVARTLRRATAPLSVESGARIHAGENNRVAPRSQPGGLPQSGSVSPRSGSANSPLHDQSALNQTSTALAASTLSRIGVERAIEELVPDSALTRTSGLNPAAGGNSTTVGSQEQTALATITRTFQDRFASQAADREAFHTLMRQSFGDGYNEEKAEAIRQQTLAGDFSWMPDIKLVNGSELTDISGQQTGGVGHGAYSKANDTIYLSRELLSSDPSKAEHILTEEVGHALDARVNTIDAAGDEGAIFSKLSHGEKLSTSELAALKSENDSGTILIDGREVEVEFGFSLRSLGRSLSRGIRRIGRSIRRGIKGIARSIKNGFNRIMQSKILGVVLSVARFIPIPIVQAAAYAINAARAAYSLYQGVKHGSIGAVLGGVAGLAGGVARFGGAVGATGSWVGTAQKIAATAGSASKAYSLLARQDVGAALGFLSGQLGQDSRLAGLLKTAQSANTVYQAKKSGDFLGAVGAGATFLQEFTGPAGDRLLDRIATHAGNAKKLEVAFDQGDVAGALQLLNESLGTNLPTEIRLNPELASRVQTASTTLKNILEARTLIENREFASAAGLLHRTMGAHAPQSALAVTLGDAATTLKTIDTAVEAARSGQFTLSTELVSQVLNRPLDDNTKAFVASLQSFNEKALQFSGAIEKGNADTAGRILESMLNEKMPGALEIFNSIAPAAILLGDLKSSIETCQFARASAIADELAEMSNQKDIRRGLQRLSDVLEGRIQVFTGMPNSAAIHR
ncbi:MAG: hypothetical protein KTR33_12235 [Gammaproteobacteria bacterium]|nr:hypothetical protein [Gammaproteobacteria bacterium]